MANKIVLIGSGRHQENEAASAITPGHLIELTSTDKLQKHSTLAGEAEKFFATEDALQGKTIDDDYALDDIVMGFLAQSGDVINAFLKDGEIAVIGSKLVSGGDGTLRVVDELATAVSVDQVIGIALEALDLSATAAVDTRLSVRIL